MQDLPKRKNLRLSGYDYSLAGAYFITICTHHRKLLFGGLVGAIISKTIGYLKSTVSKIIHETSPGLLVWQHGFYDHIIRNETDYLHIWQYINENPAKWEEDQYFFDINRENT